MKTEFSKLSGDSLVVAAFTLVLSAAPSWAGSGTVQIELYKAGFIVGVSGGKGTLKYGGKTHNLGMHPTTPVPSD